MFLIINLTIFFYGCLISQIAPVKDGSDQWIGRPFAELEKILARPTSYASRIGWKKSKYKLSNQNWGFDEPIRKECIAQWEIDSNGIIVDYELKGKGCY
ncbi:MAG: hypothetical protein GY874_10970 [Desulfobacteraceae bacterium]|nr:hypothetical protein [Desulfobacteraceae bacterium]